MPTLPARGPQKYHPSSGPDPNHPYAHPSVVSVSITPTDMIDVVGSVLSASFTMHRAIRLADHAVDELHALVDAAGTEVQDLVRQGRRLTGLIGAVSVLPRAICLFLFAAKKSSWVRLFPFAQSCRKEMEVATVSYVVLIFAAAVARLSRRLHARHI